MQWTRQIISCLVVLLIGLLTVVPRPVFAEVNMARGGIGGVDNGTLTGGDGSGNAQITINIVDLGLVKQARDLSGIVLPNGSDVMAGKQIYFVLYVDNHTQAPVDDLRLFDSLNESEFTYIPNSLEIVIVPSGSDDSQIWAGSWEPQTDSLGPPDDMASISDTGEPTGGDRVTIGATPGQINQITNIPAESTLAIRFRVGVN